MRMIPLVPVLALLCGLLGGPAGAAEPPRAWLREWPSTDFSRSAVAFSEIQSGGPARDGIPSIDKPQFEKADRMAAPPAPTEPVMSIDIDGDARAYPLAILIWHEIVNDLVGGIPVAITFCPLCNSGVVFRREVDGETTTFGTTGKLRHSDLVMYDRLSETWWQQYEGRAIVGTHVGTVLTRLPARLESFADFSARHPQGLVLVPREQARDYGRNPYRGYDSSERPFLYEGRYEGPGTPLMRVVAVAGLDEAWSLPLLRERGEVRTGDLSIRWKPGQASALDAELIASGRDVGTVTVERLLPGGGKEPVAHDVPFAFAFRAFHPGATIHHTP